MRDVVARLSDMEHAFTGNHFGGRYTVRWQMRHPLFRFARKTSRGYATTVIFIPVIYQRQACSVLFNGRYHHGMLVLPSIEKYMVVRNEVRASLKQKQRFS